MIYSSIYSFASNKRRCCILFRVFVAPYALLWGLYKISQTNHPEFLTKFASSFSGASRANAHAESFVFNTGLLIQKRNYVPVSISLKDCSFTLALGLLEPVHNGWWLRG